MGHMLIEIYSDVVCPWCYIGKRRLDGALATAAGEGVELAWRPYQLYPNLPATGMDRDEYLARRYGDRADRARVPRQIVSEGADAGITFDYGAIGRMPNTLTAHRLLDYVERVAGSGVQHELAEVLFRFYFCEGRDVGDIDTLCEGAEEAGFDAAAAREYLLDGDDEDAMRSRIKGAFEIGVVSVPCYMLMRGASPSRSPAEGSLMRGASPSRSPAEGGFMLPGAQTSEVMAQFIERAKAKLADTA